MSLEADTSVTGNSAEGLNETLKRFIGRAEENKAVLQKEIRELEENEPPVSFHEKNPRVNARLAYARAELVAAQKALDILTSVGKPVPFGTSKDRVLYDVRNGWQTVNPEHGGVTSPVRFEKDGITSLSSYFAATDPQAVAESAQRGSEKGSLFTTQSPFIAHGTTKYLYHDMRVTPVGLPGDQEKKLSTLKPGEQEVWGTDVDGVTLVYERLMVPKERDPNYTEEVARVRVAVAGSRYADGK